MGVTEPHKPQPVPTLTESHLWSAFEGLEPARYMTADLHKRYLQWAKESGVPPVTSIVAFGLFLGRTGKLNRKQVKGKSSWFVPEMVWRSPLEGQPLPTKTWAEMHPDS